jgi:hypothetical protein
MRKPRRHIVENSGGRLHIAGERDDDKACESLIVLLLRSDGKERAEVLAIAGLEDLADYRRLAELGMHVTQDCRHRSLRRALTYRTVNDFSPARSIDDAKRLLLTRRSRAPCKPSGSECQANDAGYPAIDHRISSYFSGAPTNVNQA